MLFLIFPGPRHRLPANRLLSKSITPFVFIYVKNILATTHPPRPAVTPYNDMYAMPSRLVSTLHSHWTALQLASFHPSSSSSLPLLYPIYTISVLAQYSRFLFFSWSCCEVAVSFFHALNSRCFSTRIFTCLACRQVCDNVVLTSRASGDTLWRFRAFIFIIFQVRDC